LPRSSFQAKGQGDNPESSGQVEETEVRVQKAKLEPTGQSPGEKGAAQSKLLRSVEASPTV